MNKIYTLIRLFLVLGFGYSSAICKSGLNESQSDSSFSKPVKQNYMIVRYVVGSGGVLGATGPNHIHSATVGETFVGFNQGINNLLLSGFWHPGFTFTSVNQKKDISLPKAFILHQNHPNPFNPQTTIQYDLPCQCLVSVEIFNVVSQRIQFLSSRIQGPGRFQVFWNGRDEQGKVMGSGIYFYRITAFETSTEKGKSNILFQQTKKMFLIK